MTCETAGQPQDMRDVADPVAHVSPSSNELVMPSADRTNHPAPREQGSRIASEVYGSFWLDDTEFALGAYAIKEVVNQPETISAMPLSPPFMLGVFNLRGRIIPIVDLRLLLEFPDRSVADRKVAIVEDGELCIGLMVDRTGEVLNVQGVARVDFGAKQGSPKDVVVEGLLKLNGGKRIVQILDPFELLNLKRVPRGETMAREGTQVAAASRGPRFNCLSFQFGHTTCAIDLRHVTEVMDAPEIMESVLVHDCFIGITNVRGKIIPVADFRNFMGDTAQLKDSKSTSRQRKMLIIETQGGLIGFLVYSIDSIVSCFKKEILKFTKLALPRDDIVKGCLLSKNNSIVMLLNHDVIKRDPLLVDTALRCNEIHPSEEPGKIKTSTRSASARLTYIVFTFDTCFALDTAKVSEVIDCPQSLLQPPYAVDFIDGVMDLRGELISLINPRKLYRMPSDERLGGKVVIFKENEDKYGLVVDSVDEIVNTTAGQVGDMPALNHKSNSMKVADDICGCVHSATRGSVMILDVDALLRRCFDIAGEHKISLASAD